MGKHRQIFPAIDVRSAAARKRAHSLGNAKIRDGDSQRRSEISERNRYGATESKTEQNRRINELVLRRARKLDEKFAEESRC